MPGGHCPYLTGTVVTCRRVADQGTYLITGGVARCGG